ncbi:MAG: Rieske 2Fe-2S domain-containing protein [Gammaproteobacteria bacterium]|nr:Rieske 2Fe-2S domain-containing protein [Gammaproteobacteria bacterium]MBQ0840351.1 Rieske 2Fe-2S domain-containing protein [Gammaproteobacteria bacterium]
MPKYSVGKTSDIPPGQRKVTKVAGNKVIVFHLDSGFYATQASCPHMKLPLGKGNMLEGDVLQCPIHRAKFCVKTGEVKQWACFPPGIQLLNVVRGEKPLKTYPVHIENDEVFVEL